MDGYTILPLGRFDPVICSRIHCTQLQAAQMIPKNWRGRPERETERQTYKFNFIPLGSFVPQCSDNIWIDLYTYIRCPPRIFLDSYEYFHMQQNMRAVMVHTNGHQKATRTTRQRDRETNRRTYKLNWTPLGSSGPQCGDKTIYPYIYTSNYDIFAHIILAKHLLLHIQDYNYGSGPVLTRTLTRPGWPRDFCANVFLRAPPNALF